LLGRDLSVGLTGDLLLSGGSGAALLRQSGLVLTVAFPVAVQATASISALPRAEKRFMNEPCRAIGPSDNGE